jgi:DNA-binding NarL/FixJ family response regulator
MIPVAVVEDHPLYRRGIVQTIEATDACQLVMAVDSFEALESAGIKPDWVVILDLHLPGVEGSEAVRSVCESGAAVLVLSASDNADEVIDAIAAGAAGYLTKSADTDEIVRAIRAVAAGEAYVSPALAGHLLARSRRNVPAGSGLELTVREREILELVAEGETDADIADRLYISIRTVHSHLDRIRDKTGLRRRSELTRYAIEHHMNRPPRPHP